MLNVRWFGSSRQQLHAQALDLFKVGIAGDHYRIVLERESSYPQIVLGYRATFCREQGLRFAIATRGCRIAMQHRHSLSKLIEASKIAFLSD